MGYNKQYRNINNVFGSNPEKILQEHYHKIDKNKPVLDIGAGQGRNSIFLAQKGFEVIALDPSEVVIESIQQTKLKSKYPIITYLGDFERFTAGNQSFGAILLFGLLQILSWEEINCLIEKLEKWIHPDGLLFITAFSISDSGYSLYVSKWQQVAAHSFSDGQGQVRTFLEPDQILKMFPHKEVLCHWEGLGPKHHHGNKIMEQHAMVEAVFRF